MRWVVLAAVMWPLAAVAQGEPSPPNVNDCTFIRDPVALRDCLDRSRIGKRNGPAIGALPPDPDTTGSLAAPESRLLKPEQLRAAHGARVAPRAGAAKRSVTIEQVGPRKSGGSRPSAARGR
jgi:hypothetical protein